MESALRSSTKITATLAVAALALAATGCSKKADTQAAGGNNSGQICKTTGQGPKIGLAYDIGGRGDRSFNDLAAAGVKQASDQLDATCKESEAAPNEAESAKEERLRTLAAAGFNPVIGVGFVYSVPMNKVAKEYPNVKFGVVDGFAEGPNITNLVFTPEQGAFLVGVAAGLKTKTNKLGFVGGVRGPIIDPFLAGFQAGVTAVNPAAKVDARWLSDKADDKAFKNSAGGKTAANALYDAGADVVFHASGLSGAGVFEAATAADKWAIGVDSDQYLGASPAQQKHILTSSLKRVDVAVFDFAKAFKDGTTKAGFDSYGIKLDGVGYATSGGFIDDIKPKIETYKAKIISGEITVPSKL